MNFNNTLLNAFAGGMYRMVDLTFHFRNFVKLCYYYLLHFSRLCPLLHTHIFVSSTKIFGKCCIWVNFSLSIVSAMQPLFLFINLDFYRKCIWLHGFAKVPKVYRLYKYTFISPIFCILIFINLKIMDLNLYMSK